MNQPTSRRSALKFLGLGGITTAIAPGVLLQACQDAAVADAAGQAAYKTLDAAQAKTLGMIQDVILPRTDTPSATDVGSVAFVDTWLTYGYKEADRDRFLYRLGKFGDLLEKDEQVTVADLDAARAEIMMKRYFADFESAGEGDNIMEIEGNKVERKEKDDADEVFEGQRELEERRELGTHTQVEETIVYADDATEVNELLTGLRWMTLESFYQSKEIGMNVLNYEPVPGKYIGKLPMSEVPNGYAWSL